MNETETRAELIDPALVAAGWGVVEDSRVRREFPITKGRIKPGGRRTSALFAGYVLVYRGKKLATIEARSDEKEAGDGVAQAIDYAKRLNLNTTFATNGKEIYRICMKTSDQGTVDRYPTARTLGRNVCFRKRMAGQVRVGALQRCRRNETSSLLSRERR